MTTRSYLTVVDEAFAEKASAQITVTLKDETDTLVDDGTLTTLTLTLYDKDRPTESVINSRIAQSVLNTNGGALASSVLTMTLSPADMAIQNTARTSEVHVALFEYTWSGGTKAGKAVVEFTVDNLTKVL